MGVRNSAQQMGGSRTEGAAREPETQFWGRSISQIESFCPSLGEYATSHAGVATLESNPQGQGLVFVDGKKAQHAVQKAVSVDLHQFWNSQARNLAESVLLPLLYVQATTPCEAQCSRELCTAAVLAYEYVLFLPQSAFEDASGVPGAVPCSTQEPDNEPHRWRKLAQT